MKTKENNVIQKIYNAGLRFLTPMNLEETYATIVKEALKLTGGDYGSIFIYEDGEFKRVYTNAKGLYKVKVRKKGLTYKVFKTQTPVFQDYKQIKELPHPYYKYGIDLHSDLMFPLIYQGKSFGIIDVMSVQDYKFAKEQLHILELLVPLVTLVLRKAQLYDEVKKALETRDLFIAMAAHELRTPLTSVNGYIQLLRSKFSGSDKTEARWIDNLYWESERLKILVNELLEINRIKTGQLQYKLRECSLREIVSRVNANFRFSYPERELVIEDKLGNRQDTIIGDYDKIMQLVTNLIDNAAKFSPPTSKLVITLGANDSQLQLKVKDSGIGINKNDLGRIFEGYQRGSGHDREGLGMGLFLVKDIVTRLHGEIKVHSKVNKGTTMEVLLPKAHV